MGGVQVNFGRDSGGEGFFPARHAQTPTVSGAQSGESVLWDGGYQVVALRLGKLEKFVVHDSAHEVQTEVAFAGIAAPVAEKSGEWVAPAFAQRFA